MSPSSESPSNVSSVDDGYCLFARKFEIPNIETDSLQWNAEWEKALKTLSASKVYTTMSGLFKGDETDLEMVDRLKHKVASLQDKTVELWGEDKTFVVAWQLLSDEEHKHYLLNGIWDACKMASCKQDSRVFCPDVTTTAMAKGKGKAFIDSVIDFYTHKSRVGEGNTYSIPSPWWDDAVKDLPQPLEGRDKTAFLYLTLLRDEFMGRFFIVVRKQSLICLE